MGSGFGGLGWRSIGGLQSDSDDTLMIRLVLESVSRVKC